MKTQNNIWEMDKKLFFQSNRYFSRSRKLYSSVYCAVGKCSIFVVKLIRKIKLRLALTFRGFSCVFELRPITSINCSQMEFGK